MRMLLTDPYGAPLTYDLPVGPGSIAPVVMGVARLADGELVLVASLDPTKGSVYASMLVGYVMPEDQS